jgi:S-disulfanyl-L-cysteine oxidoreductase SoxD
MIRLLRARKACHVPASYFSGFAMLQLRPFSVCLVLLMVSGAGFALAQPAARTAQDGVFTSAQADRGNTLFQDNCATCHGGSLQGEDENPPLSGKHFASRWGGLPVSAIYGFINTQMPLGQPGAMGAQGNADIVAYILSVNKFPAGQTELPADNNALKAITINKLQQ